MSDNIFIDTNIFVYPLWDDQSQKHSKDCISAALNWVTE